MRPLPHGMSAESTIRIDADGRFLHDGAPVEHPKLQRALARWIDVHPDDGRYILKNAISWCYITVDDAPIQVRSVARAPAGFLLTLSDQTTETLDPTSLRIDADEVPYCDVRGGALPARFSRQAAFELLDAWENTPIRRVLRGEGAKRR